MEHQPGEELLRFVIAKAEVISFLRELSRDQGRPLEIPMLDGPQDALTTLPPSMSTAGEAAAYALESLLAACRELRLQMNGEQSGYERFRQGLALLCNEIGRTIPVSLDEKSARGLTCEQADETLRTLRRQVEEGLI